MREYLIRAAAAGLSWPLPEGMDAEALEGRLFPPIAAVADRPVPEWRAVHRELKSRRHRVTLRLLWLEWKADNPDGWCYSQFCQHYRDWLGTQDVVMRLSYAGGERMFVDFSGDKAPDWVEPDSGEVHRDEVFVSVLGASGVDLRPGDRRPGPGLVDRGARACLGGVWGCGRGHHPRQPSGGGVQGVLV